MARRLATLPEFEIHLSFSDGFYSLVRGNRLWNTYSRNALGDELLKHHQQRIPKHFQLGAHAKYGYAERKGSTKKKKKNYWKVHPENDQLRSGAQSRVLMANRRIAFSGAFGGPGSGGTLRGRLIMRRPRALRQAINGGIGPEQLEKEIVSTTEQERREIGEGYRDRLVRQIAGYHGSMRRYDGSTGRLWRGSHRQYGALRSVL